MHQKVVVRTRRKWVAWLAPLLLVPGILSSLTPSLFGAEKWIGLLSPHFSAVSNAGEKKSKKLLNELERFRSAFLQIFAVDDSRLPPVRVIFFRNDRSFNPFKPQLNGKPVPAAGFFDGREDYALIAVNAGTGDWAVSAVYHEFVHFLASDLARPLPTWLEEGLATFYSSFESDGGGITLGGPHEGYLDLLRRSSMMSMDRMTKVDRLSEEYNERRAKHRFYAQSWAFVHFLMMDGRMSRRPQLIRFIELLGQGAESDSAFVEAFGGPPSEFEIKLYSYIRKPSFYLMRIRGAELAESEISVFPVSEGAASVHLGNLLRRQGRYDEARQRYERALEESPDLRPARIGLGYIAAYENRFKEAKDLLEPYALEESSDFYLNYHYGVVLAELAAAFDWGGAPLNREDFERLARPFRRSLQLRPRFSASALMLAALHLAAGRDLQEGVGLIGTALSRHPGDEGLLDVLADLQLAAGDWDGADETLKRLIEGDYESIRKTALARLASLDALKAAELRKAVAGLTLKLEGPRPRSAPGWSTGSDSGPGCVAGFEEPDRAVVSRGRLLRLECGEGEVYVIDVAGEKAKFVADVPESELLFGCGSDLGPLACGDHDYQATVYLSPELELDPRTGAYKALAIEIRAP